MNNPTLYALLVGAEQVQDGVFNRGSMLVGGVGSIKRVDMAGIGVRYVSGMVKSGGKVYRPIIQFSRVDGVDVTEDMPCTVRCQCESFQYYFAGANKKHHALFGGKFKWGVRPTPRVGHVSVPRNPGKVPGVCKHVVALWLAIKGQPTGC